MQVCRAYPDRVVILFAGLPVSLVEFESGKKRPVVILLTTSILSGIGQNETISSTALEGQVLTATAVDLPFSTPLTTNHL